MKRDDCSAWKEERQRQDDLVNEAFADILAGRFDSDAVHEAMLLGHHEDHQRLRAERDTALRVARATGATT
jgi:hypothetical protein